MKTKIIATVIALTVLLAAQVHAEPAFDFQITGDRTAEHAAYLGVPEEGPFLIEDMDAPVVLIQIFSMYCPHCQAEAPHMKEFFSLLKDSDIADKVKLLAIGAGNSQFEVDYFRDNYGLSYPLFIDPDYVIHQKTGEVNTPHYFLVTTADQTLLFEQTGRFETAQSFLDLLQTKLKSK